MMTSWKPCHGGALAEGGCVQQLTHLTKSAQEEQQEKQLYIPLHSARRYWKDFGNIWTDRDEFAMVSMLCCRENGWIRREYSRAGRAFPLCLPEEN